MVEYRVEALAKGLRILSLSLSSGRPGSRNTQRRVGDAGRRARAHGLRSVAAPVRDADGSVVAGANLAVQSRDWSSQRKVRELRPLVTDACADISAILGFAA